ncbi:hypothetical protein [Salibacterium lacus]|uniref:Uncharacterized protein n=1 Tax=Salibacterium lacus TaxID=1898109 RepID=A0ABW5SYV5_9BACI
MAKTYTETLSVVEQRMHHEVLAQFFESRPDIYPPNFAAYHRRKLAELDAEGAADHAGE